MSQRCGATALYCLNGPFYVHDYPGIVKPHVCFHAIPYFFHGYLQGADWLLPVGLLWVDSVGSVLISSTPSWKCVAGSWTQYRILKE
jgi:hypothetical protein